jgi:hypothetical protein
MEKNISHKIAVALTATALVAGGLTGAAIYATTVEPTVIQGEPFVINATSEQVLNAFKEGVASVPFVEPVVITNTTVEYKEVSVEDTAFLALACDRLLYDDLVECKKEVSAEDEALKLAIAEIEADFAREAERAGLILDDRRASLIKVYDVFEDVEVVSSDYKRAKYEFEITARVEDERADTKLDVTYTVRVDNGVAKIVDAN